jgi:hypothetical protein
MNTELFFADWPSVYKELTGKTVDWDFVAQSVIQQSDHYLKNPLHRTEWDEDYVLEAQFFYFTVLNYWRVQRALAQAQFFSFAAPFNHILDVGCGLGAGFLNFANSNKSIFAYDQSPSALKWARKLSQILGLKVEFLDSPQQFTHKDTLLVASYTLTERADPLKFVKWAKSFPGILIVEPSLQEDGRNLQKIRQALINQKFYAWAPCTHQLHCPLLEHSKTDWCHDKIRFSPPPWFLNLANRLPMQLSELGFSYLACSVFEPQKKNWARVVGDPLEEKGKFRLLTCFDSSRIFISALRRKKTEISLMRGDLFELPEEISKHGNEIRTTGPIKLVYRN